VARSSAAIELRRVGPGSSTESALEAGRLCSRILAALSASVAHGGLVLVLRPAGQGTEPPQQPRPQLKRRLHTTPMELTFGSFNLSE
jgi:hypothetical protein